MFDGTLRHLGPAPIAELARILPAVSDTVWNANPIRQERFAMHRQTRSLIFRYVPGDEPAVFHDLPPWLAWRARLEPVVEAATASFGPGKACRILLANLEAGGRIAMHRDHGPTYERTHRVHVPVITDPAVRFYIDGDNYFLDAGEAYEINNLLPHGVANDSESDRVHLIIDYLPDAA